MLKTEPIETEEFNGHTINIFQDEDPENPREWDNMTEIHCSHKRYNMGDKGFNYRTGSKCMEVADEAKKQGDIVLPLYMYDHSGQTISLSPFSCPWDSGQVGFVIIRREKMLKEFGKKILSKGLKNKAIEFAKNEVETYDKFIRGEVFGYRIDEDGDSCWGFYSVKDAIEEAKEGI